MVQRIVRTTEVGAAPVVAVGFFGSLVIAIVSGLIVHAITSRKGW